MLRRKLMINLLVIIISGIVILSIPVIVNHLTKSTQAATDQTNNYTLVSEFVGDRYQDVMDCNWIWQVCQMSGDTVVTSWEKIYQNVQFLQYDPVLQITEAGLCYKGKNPNYYSYVTYQGQTCLIKIPTHHDDN